MIKRTKFEEMCTESKMFPVPEFDFIAIGREGLLVEVDKLTKQFNEIPSFKKNKRGIPVYKLINYKNEEVKISLSRLMMNTFVGIWDEAQINNEEFLDISDMNYEIETMVNDSDDDLYINERLFKRIYIDEKPVNYFISDNGIIYSSRSHKFLKFAFQYNYYLRSQLRDNGKSTLFGNHRLVYETWTGEKLTPDIPMNHINGRKNDNYYKNLEKSTPRENLHHAMENKLRYARWNESKVRKICEMLETNEFKPVEIANKMGYTHDNDIRATQFLIKRINSLDSWSHISKDYDLSNYQNTIHLSNKTDEDAHIVCRLFIEGKSRKEIQNETGHSAAWINDIIRGDIYRHVSEEYDIDRSSFRSATDLSKYKNIANDVMNGKTNFGNLATKYKVPKLSVRRFIQRRIHVDLGLKYEFEKILPDLHYINQHPNYLQRD